MQAYHLVFGVRGTTYDRAMQEQPAARADEFHQVVARLAPRAGTVVGDVPAGGDYLRRHLPTDVGVLGFDPATGFGGQTGGSLQSLPWVDSQVDDVVSIAASHHEEDKTAFFAELRRVCRARGRFVLADVESGSPTAHFLDHFVGAYNSTGHAGLFLDRTGTAGELRAAGWAVLSVERVLVRWHFADAPCLARFCRQLFDLRDVEDQQLIGEIDSRLGIEAHARGIAMRWPMLMFVGQRH